MPPTRRRAVRSGVSLAAAAVAGCASRLAGGPDATPTESCRATDPPMPTTAPTDPKRYPERPSRLTTETVRSFVEPYERAYQYNAELADHPAEIGRRNELDVDVQETTVEVGGDRFTVRVSGDRYLSITDQDHTTTPATATPTPLPIGRRPFSATYVVSSRRVRREGVVVECW